MADEPPAESIQRVIAHADAASMTADKHQQEDYMLQ
jgi:hypothetical protein